MNKLAPLALALVILPVALLAAPLPVVLLFPAKTDQGAPSSLASEGTLALKTYLRQAGKTEVTDFDVDSPLVQRALLENKVNPEELSSVSELSAKLDMGKRLGVDMILGAEISEKDEKVYVRASLADTKTGKVWSLETNADIAKTGDRNRALSNAVQTAVSAAVYSYSREALKGIESVSPDSNSSAPPSTPSGASASPTGPLVEPPADAATHVAKAEELSKAGDDASAISEYREAINIEPKNVGLRLKLVNLYVKRKLFTQALDELARAQQIEPGNASLVSEQIKIYQETGATDKVAQLYLNQADRNPQDARYRMAAGDYYWQQKMGDDAIKQYRLAAEVDPSNPLPHERIALILLTQARFDDASVETDLLRKLDPSPEATVAKERYGRFVAVALDALKKLIAEYDSASGSFGAKKTTREEYYKQVEDCSSRTDSVAKFLDTLIPPGPQATGYQHMVLGCSLVSQACSKELSYLETNDSSESDSAAIFISEAKKHLLRAEAG